MLHIKCPHCGMRSQNEFSYGGDATIKRPELGKEISDQDWDNFVYNRKSLRGPEEAPELVPENHLLRMPFIYPLW